MVRAYSSYANCTKVLLDSGQSYDDVSDYEPEATSSIPVPTVSLANGVEMPYLGLGTTHSGGYYHDVVVHALRNCGYRMIDTARRYGVERELGLAWKESGVPREFLFLCSKLWPTDFGPGTRPAFELSCEKLQTDYLDLYMTHFPVVPDYMGNARSLREETWRQLELLYDEGRIRAIGVSNYSEDDLVALLEYCSVVPHVNQYEFHPWYNPRELRSFCGENHILYAGYCPIAKGKFLDSEVLQKLSAKHKKTPAQICLRWSLEHGVPVIPKSKEKQRVAENKDVFDFSLSADDMNELETLQICPKKLVRFDDLPNKFDLPDGYKLNGRVFGVPTELIAREHSSVVNGTRFAQDAILRTHRLHTIAFDLDSSCKGETANGKRGEGAFDQKTPTAFERIVHGSIVQLIECGSKNGGMFRFVRYCRYAVAFIAFAALEPSGALKCWKWHLMTTPYRVSDIGPELHPQCSFMLDAPCLSKIIAHSCMTSFSFFNEAHNTCYVDEAGFVKCVCDTDFCSSNCTYIVKLWKESEAYRDYHDTNKGSCMRAYERACKLGRIRIPVEGENIQNDPVEVDEGVDAVL